MKLIVTHPGRAHRDEFLAVAFLLSFYGEETSVIRREPTQDDLNDDEVAVVDVGMTHEPDSMNFDHHHLTVDHPPCCALTLVLQHLGHYDAAMEFSPWMAFTEEIDSKGPKFAFETLGVPIDAMQSLRSPIEVMLLGIFAEMGEVPVEFKRLMLDIAQGHIGKWNSLKSRMTILDLNVSIQTVDDLCVAVVLLKADEKPLLGLEHWFQKNNINPAVTVSRPHRQSPEGWALYRRNDHHRVDFTNTQRCLFNHASGFLAVTEPMEINEALELVKNSIEK